MPKLLSELADAFPNDPVCVQVNPPGFRLLPRSNSRHFVQQAAKPTAGRSVDKQLTSWRGLCRPSMAAKRLYKAGWKRKAFAAVHSRNKSQVSATPSSLQIRQIGAGPLTFPGLGGGGGGGGGAPRASTFLCVRHVYKL